MRALVLGAGVVGVTTAHFLQKAGISVTVLERRPGAAEEGSYANGAQLSYSHIEPWAEPTTLAHLVPWLISPNSPLSVRKTIDPLFWKWGVQFLWAASSTSRAKETASRTWALASESRSAMESLLAEHPSLFTYRKSGIMHLYRDPDQWRKTHSLIEWKQSLGIEVVKLTKEQCSKKEPALVVDNIQGGLWYPQDATGDAHQFTISLANLCKQQGVKFYYHTNIHEILVQDGKVQGVLTDKGDFRADIVVSTLGAESNRILARCGVHVPLYPLKGYSLTIPLQQEEPYFAQPVTDVGNKIVATRIGNKLRVAGMVECAGFSNYIYPDRIALLKKQTLQLFPSLADKIEDSESWTCLRPYVPDGRPWIARTQRYPNLYLNTGHGSLGWTLACGSARRIVELIER